MWGFHWPVGGPNYWGGECAIACSKSLVTSSLVKVSLFCMHCQATQFVSHRRYGLRWLREVNLAKSTEYLLPETTCLLSIPPFRLWSDPSCPGVKETVLQCIWGFQCRDTSGCTCSYLYVPILRIGLPVLIKFTLSSRVCQSLPLPLPVVVTSRHITLSIHTQINNPVLFLFT